MKFIKRIIELLIVVALIVGAVFYFNRNTVSDKQANSYLKKDTCYSYYYSQLDDTHKSLYSKLYYAFNHRYSVLELTDVNKDDIDLAFKSVCYDHPELYYVNKTYQYVDMFNLYEIKINYNYTKEECETYNQQLEKIAGDIKSHTGSLSSLEKVKYVYDYIIEHVTYQQTNNDQDMISALIDGKSVCAGYARAYQYLLNQLDINCAYMQGNAKEVVNEGDDTGHAWLMIQLFGDYYYSDATWGDVTTEGFAHTCYAPFLLSSDEMLEAYTPEGNYEKTSSTSFDYYKTIHCYMNGYSEDVLSYALRYTLLNNKDIVEIKCNNQSTYNTLMTQLKESPVLYQLLERNGHNYSKASYVSREEWHIVEVHFYN